MTHMSTSERITVTAGLLRNWPLPPVVGGKNERGQVLIVGGSRETVGAVALAAEAALRVGAGKLQVATVESRASELSVALPEALVRPLPETTAGHVDPASSDRLVDLAGDADAVVIGPGLAGVECARAFVKRLLPSVKGRVVLDALALSVVALDPSGDELRVVAPPAVLTPNLSELGVLVGSDVDDPAGDAARVARAVGAVVHGGGELSVTAAPDGRVWVDDHGNNGLGVSGSGDVLAGAVGGLLARGAEPAQAALWGARLHAEAGNRLAAAIGPVGFLAREIATELAPALRQLG
jgi:ADP-dependent NAD(P)H-hydrate dehydratase